MSGFSTETRLSRVVTGERDTVWYPRTPRHGKCGIILFHGQSNPNMFKDTTQLASVRLADTLASVGVPCIAAEMRGNAWANNQAISEVPAYFNLLKADFPNMRTDKYIALGISMGAAFVARLTQNTPNSVAAAVGIIPAYDPLAIYNYGNVGDAAMETAWGFSGVGNFPDVLNLGPKAALASSVPLLTGYASNDSLVPASSVTAYHALAGGAPENVINVGALEHTDAAIAAVPITTIARFLAANGA